MCHPVLQSYMNLEVASGQGEICYMMESVTPDLAPVGNLQVALSQV